MRQFAKSVLPLLGCLIFLVGCNVFQEDSRARWFHDPGREMGAPGQMIPQHDFERAAFDPQAAQIETNMARENPACSITRVPTKSL